MSTFRLFKLFLITNIFYIFFRWEPYPQRPIGYAISTLNMERPSRSNMKKSSQFGKPWFQRPRSIDKNWMNPTFYIDSCPISGRFFKGLLFIMYYECWNSRKNEFPKRIPQKEYFPYPGWITGIWIPSPEYESPPRDMNPPPLL